MWEKVSQFCVEQKHPEKLQLRWYIRAIPVSIPLHPFLFITPCRVLPKPLDVPDQQTSLVRFLIEELGVPHIAITTIQHDSQPVKLPPFPLLPHRDSNQQNPAEQIVKYSTYHTGD
ncbi:hypothetical protein AVEN_109555-1 [Araneus ventricosus]|uniref:Uncharacterized protein n=1 Tax=Araneus ventricosus TaxID=182803 RepID=A0A4Y2GBY1_ARAVE|nr:hypothetical protein AVEN_109555-1 [Araneus ventricosus]